MNRQSLYSGILIGLGACGFLALGGLSGAVMFTFGLVGVVLYGTPLYTGRAGVMPPHQWLDLTKIWFFNALGCALLGLLVWSLGGESVQKAQSLMEGRIAQGPWRSFLRAVGCGIIIDSVVWLYRTKKSIIPVLFGVPLFIVCGFYHSIADVVYMVAAWKWSPALLWYYPLIVLGNYVGCNVRRLVLPQEKAE